MRILKDATPRNKEFETLVSLNETDLKTYLKTKVANRGGTVISDDGYLFYKGGFPVLLCAHMDTVHDKEPTTIVYANGTISSPQGIGGDDRCGIYMILKILKRYDCSVLFLEDEEIGCVGAKKFARTELARSLEKEEKLKYIIEFDRKGNNHAVFYDCDNPNFTKFITQGFFKKETGTCSDISYIAPALGIAAVNLSCGYYHEHYIDHYVNLAEMEKVIEEAIGLLDKTSEVERFKYVRGNSYSYNNYYGRYYDNYDSYDYDYGYGYGYGRSYYSKKYFFKFLLTENRTQYIRETFIKGNEIEECFYKFFKEYPSVCYNDVLAHGWFEDNKSY